MRNYWPDQPPPLVMGLSPGVKRLIIATAIVFLLQWVFNPLTGGGFSYFFALSQAGIMAGRIWQFATYLFLHAGVWHLLLNMLMLYFMGPDVERTLGTRHFLVLYFLSGILGGLGWLLINTHPWIPCVGASGAVFGVLAAFAALFPRRQITLLLFFVLPISMKAWQMVSLMGLIELGFLISNPDGGIAYAAQGAGGISGLIYTAILIRRPGGFGNPFAARGRPRLTILQPAQPLPTFSEAEIDAILDKISRQGLGSLTRAEREKLEQASREGYGRQR